MRKILLFSHSGFSDTDANGITMKNLLSAYSPEEKAEFYCDTQPPDYAAACDYFRVTDVQMLKAFLGKTSQHVFRYSPDKEIVSKPKTECVGAKKIPVWLKKQKYNFVAKWLREWLWCISPWGHRKLQKWIRECDPSAIVYMVGESIFMDRLVLKTCRELDVPLVLYNGEAYRIIDLKKRYGLERAYYRGTQKLYHKLNAQAKLVIYNCEMLKQDYEAIYARVGQTMIGYNSADCNMNLYSPNEEVVVTYFGNLGVGRSDVLIQVAQILSEIRPGLKLNIYGNALPESEERFRRRENICYHGFVDAKQLREIIEKTDILLHVESFDEKIMPKLKYAFSTKIAQCLCAGRCFVSYAPLGAASSQYLATVEGAVMVASEEELRLKLRELVSDAALRSELASKSRAVGMQNHNVKNTAKKCREMIERIINEENC